MRAFMHRFEYRTKDYPMILTMPAELILTIVYATVGPLVYAFLRLFVGRRVARRFDDFWENS